MNKPNDEIIVFREVVTFEEETHLVKDVITLAQAAQITGITQAGVRSAMNRGKLPIIWIKGVNHRYTLRGDAETFVNGRKS
ncbi:MAG: hypothetical protein ACYTFW_05200 [Planctomycetota bacterium]